jgi:hypothetical protein
MADKKTLAEVLDGMFKKNGYGYIVVSKEGNAYDGTLLIKQGKERGYALADESDSAPSKDKTVAEKAENKSRAKDKTAAKDKPEKKAKPESDTAETDADKAEQDAARKLDLAKRLAKDGKTDKAKTRLEDILSKYAKTKAAEEAKTLLEKLQEQDKDK